MRSETCSVTKHNKFAERVFAYTDYLLRTKPNIKHLAQEAYVMFSLNRTVEWLETKSVEDARKLTQVAMKSVGKIREKFYERREAIREQRKELLERKRKEEAERKLKRMQEREIIFKDILFFGLYQDAARVSENVGQLKAKGDKLDALKAQLRFREHILEQEADSRLFRFSRKEADGKRANLSVEELSENVKELIRLANERGGSDVFGNRMMLGRRLIHKMNDSDGNLVDYEAEIISTVPGYPEWVNLKYNDDDDVYVEKLQEEIDNGNIVLQ